MMNGGDGTGHLAADERLSAQRTFVVERPKTAPLLVAQVDLVGTLDTGAVDRH
jgi:hypothetical protein